MNIIDEIFFIQAQKMYGTDAYVKGDANRQMKNEEGRAMYLPLDSFAHATRKKEGGLLGS